MGSSLKCCCCLPLAPRRAEAGACREQHPSQLQTWPPTGELQKSTDLASILAPQLTAVSFVIYEMQMMTVIMMIIIPDLAASPVVQEPIETYTSASAGKSIKCSKNAR